MTRAATGYDVFVRVALPVMLVFGSSALGWTFNQLQDHGNRLTIMEVRDEDMRADVQEIKQDVKKLLEGNR